jgi:hypothetical protein
MGSKCAVPKCSAPTGDGGVLLSCGDHYCTLHLLHCLVWTPSQTDVMCFKHDAKLQTISMQSLFPVGKWRLKCGCEAQIKEKFAISFAGHPTTIQDIIIKCPKGDELPFDVITKVQKAFLWDRIAPKLIQCISNNQIASIILRNILSFFVIEKKQISAEGAKAIAHAVQQTYRITTLDLGILCDMQHNVENNEIETEGATAIAKMLATNRTLISLNLCT